jgi:hypothetical protein
MVPMALGSEILMGMISILILRPTNGGIIPDKDLNPSPKNAVVICGILFVGKGLAGTSGKQHDGEIEQHDAKQLRVKRKAAIDEGVAKYGPPDVLMLDIVTPSGAVVAVDDPALIEMLGEGLRGENHLTLVHSDRALTDCRPVSLISSQTVRQVDAELGLPIDEQRFRANIYLNLASDHGFAEDEFVGRKLRNGSRAVIMVLERDPRCKMISLDPDTGEHNPEVLRKVAQAHGAAAGVYCAVLVEGMLKEGDSIEVFD